MPTDQPCWEPGQTIKLAGITVEMSRPRLVARSHNYLWFPNLAKRGDGVLVALGQEHPDLAAWPVPLWAYYSYDGGLTWRDKTCVPNVGETFINLPDGDLLLLPFYLLKHDQVQLGDGYRFRCGTTAVEPLPQQVRVDNWPIECFCPKANSPGKSDHERRMGTVFSGQCIRTRDGRYLLALFTTASMQPRFYGLVVAESTDALNWHVCSIVAIPGAGTDAYMGKEGANEATLVRVPDGRILCVYRAGGWHPNLPFGHAWSSDEGRSWTPAVPMTAGDSFLPPMSVAPSLVTMPDGALLLSGGRPGMRFWIDTTGSAQNWQHIDLQLHHTWCRPDEPILGTDHPAGKQSTSYTELLPLDDHTLLLIYDRTPNGWDPIPADSAETNSLWILRLTLRRDPKPAP